MAVINCTITNRQDYTDNQSFGDVGSYEEISGQITFAVDPAERINQSIVDLHLAEVDPQGLVRFSSDFRILTPKDQSRGNDTLLVDIPNRGRQLLTTSFNRQPGITEEDRLKPGDGFLLQQGFTQVAIGWQWDIDEPDLMKFRAPRALIKGQEITGQVICQFRPDRDQASLRIIQLGQTKPSNRVSLQGDHHLYVKDWEDDNAVEIPRQNWRFAHIKEEKGAHIEESSDIHITTDEGFKRGKIYELVYESSGARVVGAGLLAVREIASWLKSEDNLLGRPHSRAIAFGVSQTGRLLNQFLYEGLNSDNKFEKIYDGFFIHIAGSQRGDFNHRFAQPTSAGAPSFGQRYPFAATSLKDPFSDRVESLINTQLPPRVFHVNTSWEYWRGDASLLHIAPDGSRDLDLPANTRCFLISGTHHIGGLLLNGNQITELPTGGQTAHGMNIVDFRPLMRALLCQLNDWVNDTREPNRSCYPRLNDGTACSRQQVLHNFQTLNHLTPLDPDKLSRVRRLALGPDEQIGVGSYPAQEFETYPCLVSDIDAAFNEVAGIRLPDIRQPIATHTGWNPRHKDTGAGDQAATFAGLSDLLPLSPTSSDPREAIGSRYHSRDDYQKQVESAIDELVADRWLRNEDREWVLDNSMVRYDFAVSGNN